MEGSPVVAYDREDEAMGSPGGYSEQHMTHHWSPPGYLEAPSDVGNHYLGNVEDPDFREAIAGHPLCSAVSISQLAFKHLWRRYRNVPKKMNFKMLLIAPDIPGEGQRTSLASYWLLKRLSSKIVYNDGSDLMDEMIAQGPVLVGEWGSKFLQEVGRETTIQTTLWQPKLDCLEFRHRVLLEGINGVIMLVDGKQDISPGLERIRLLLDVMGSVTYVPKIVILSANLELDDSAELVHTVEHMLNQEGFSVMNYRPAVEGIHIGPYLMSLFKDVSDGIRSERGEDFQERGGHMELDERYAQGLETASDPVVWAIEAIAAKCPLYEDQQVGDDRTEEAKAAWARKVAGVSDESEDEMDLDHGVYHGEEKEAFLKSIWRYKVPGLEEGRKEKRKEERWREFGDGGEAVGQKLVSDDEEKDDIGCRKRIKGIIEDGDEVKDEDGDGDEVPLLDALTKLPQDKMFEVLSLSLHSGRKLAWDEWARRLKDNESDESTEAESV